MEQSYTIAPHFTHLHILNIMTHIQVFVTKNVKFRAIVKEDNQPSYEVTIGGSSWLNGKGRDHESIILQKCNDIIASLTSKLNNHHI